MFRVDLTNRAEKDMEICVSAGFAIPLAQIMATLELNPYEYSQGFERLTGNLKGRCSRKINYHNRVVYKVLPNNDGARDDKGILYEGIVRVFEAWGHNYRKPK